MTNIYLLGYSVRDSVGVGVSSKLLYRPQGVHGLGGLSAPCCSTLSALGLVTEFESRFGLEAATAAVTVMRRLLFAIYGPDESFL